MESNKIAEATSPAVLPLQESAVLEASTKSNVLKWCPRNRAGFILVIWWLFQLQGQMNLRELGDELRKRRNTKQFAEFELGVLDLFTDILSWHNTSQRKSQYRDNCPAPPYIALSKPCTLGPLPHTPSTNILKHNLCGSHVIPEWILRLPAIHAVVIGINRYPPQSGHDPLTGSVTDAKDIQHFLEKRLRVPPNNIISLLDEAATREAIVSKLRSLGQRKDIARDSIIFVYFSGHGTLYPLAPCCFGSTKKIVALLPVDRASGIVPDISGREINMILWEVAQKKGSQIIVVMDCCYAGGAVKGEELRIRSEPALKDGLTLMLKAAESQAYAYPCDVFAEEFQKSTSSFVAMLAASEDKPALERVTIGKCTEGIFTQELLEVLNRVCSAPSLPPSFRQITDEVKTSLEGWQIPQVFGDKANEPFLYVQANTVIQPRL